MNGLYESMTVDLPEMNESGVRVERFEVSGSASRFASITDGRRAPSAGEFTRLVVDGRLWMSDTNAEKSDHLEAVREMAARGGRVLINGLGLGMVVKAALALPNVEHVDVIELNPRVADVVGPHYSSDRCTVHTADAYAQAKAWTGGTRWTVAWHDIWPDMCEDYLSDMARLKRSYGRRVDWQGCWGQEYIRYQRTRTANAWWRS